MKRLPKSVLSMGALVLTAGALTLTLPHAAHAIAAALVQVTNTASNPAVAQTTDKQAAQLVTLAAYQVPRGAISDPTPVTFNLVDGFGSISPGAYTVPANQTLVITSVDLKPYYQSSPGECTGDSAIDYVFLNAAAIIQPRKYWNISGLSSSHFSYASGITFAPGVTPSVVDEYISACGVSVEMQGYLTVN